MDKLFPDWLSVITPDLDVAQMPRDQWWAAIEAFVAGATAADIVGLTRIVHGRRDADFDAKWREAVRKHDDVFPLRDKDRQVAVLAGAALLHASTVSDTRSLALYARRCATQADWTPALADVAITDKELAQIGVGVRELPDLAPRKHSLSTRTVQAALPAVETAVNGEQLAQAILALVEAANDAVQRTAASIVRAVIARETPFREQSDILVWVLDGHSRFSNVPWEEMSAALASVIAAVDLCALTRFDIGRSDSTALIAHAGSLGHRERDQEDLKRTVLETAGLEPCGYPDLTPVLSQVAQGEIPAAEDAQVGAKLYNELLFARLTRK